MSDKGIHVHGPHDHAVEHAGSTPGLGQQIAIFTAILATLGAVVSFLGGHTQNEALFFKNEAVLKKTEASNQWNYYQAKSTKQNLAEFASSLTNDAARVEFFKGEVARYEKEKKEIRVKAEVLEAEAAAFNENAPPAGG